MSDLLTHHWVTDLPVLREEPVEFLRLLGGPSVVTVPGIEHCSGNDALGTRDASECRVVVTLLHGNEPSGLKAILRYLREGLRPAVTLHFFIVSVATALHPPLFTHRQIPGRRDMNRTFHAPYEGIEGRLAAEILARIDALSPQAVVDIHNTSGDGPAFAVSPVLSEEHIALTHYFTHRLVVTDLRLGSLMEISSAARPVITIESGGTQGPAADELAYAGLRRFAEAENLFSWQGLPELDLYHHPVRLELAPDCTIAYDAALCAEANLCLPPDIDRFNFGIADPSVCLGRVRDATCLRLKSAGGYQPIDELFTVSVDGRLHPRIPLKLFMVTTNATIARSDCLLYAVKV